MSLANIHHAVDGEWESLPEWASYFLFLGFFIASQPKIETRAIIGVALPTRAYAAALAATGVVYNRTVIAKNRVEDESHFQSLCELPNETPVTYLHGQRNLKGVLLGCKTESGQKMLVVHIRNSRGGNESHFVRASDAVKIQLLTENPLADSASKKSARHQTGQLVAPVSDFARNLLGAEHTADFSLRSRLDCCIVGRLSALRQEINETTFATSSISAVTIPAKDKFHQGTLQDVLRVRKFMGEGKAFRTDAVASQSRNVPNLARDAAPHVTIFDGATGFTKWRDYWRDSHWLVLLDSTESGFDEAANLLNADIRNRLDDEFSDDVPPPPAGVELVYYRERLG